jgi:hypothetical protein
MIPMLAIVKRFGLRFTMVAAALCNIGAGVVRIVAPFLPISREFYFWLIFVSQIIGMVANPIVTSVAPEVSSVWFAESERAIATAVNLFF